MDLPSPLLKGLLVKRYKRFFADIKLEDGDVVTAHCPNPGAMLGLKEAGLLAFISTSDNPKRKLKFTLELLDVGSVDAPILVGINTQRPNGLAQEAIQSGLVPTLNPDADLQREVRYGQNSRIDILLTEPDGHKTYVEVKNVHMKRAGTLAEFPDSVTSRGAKHLRELCDMVTQGHRAVMLFVIQRCDVDRLAVAADIDPVYAEAFEDARLQGVEMLALKCDITQENIRPFQMIPIVDFKTS